MAKEDVITCMAVVKDTLPNTKFKVEIIDNKKIIIATVSGKIRLHNIRILPGDTVTVEISPYDLNNGRITYRHKK